MPLIIKIKYPTYKKADKTAWDSLKLKFVKSSELNSIIHHEKVDFIKCKKSYFDKWSRAYVKLINLK